jgi:hypothetical protein
MTVLKLNWPRVRSAKTNRRLLRMQSGYLIDLREPEANANASSRIPVRQTPIAEPFCGTADIVAGSRVLMEDLAV